MIARVEKSIAEDKAKKILQKARTRILYPSRKLIQDGKVVKTGAVVHEDLLKGIREEEKETAYFLCELMLLNDQSLQVIEWLGGSLKDLRELYKSAGIFENEDTFQTQINGMQKSIKDILESDKKQGRE